MSRWPKKFYGFVEVTWKPTVGAWREETAEEKARRLHRKLPAPSGAAK